MPGFGTDRHQFLLNLESSTGEDLAGKRRIFYK